MQTNTRDCDAKHTLIREMRIWREDKEKWWKILVAAENKQQQKIQQNFFFKEKEKSKIFHFQ